MWECVSHATHSNLQHAGAVLQQFGAFEDQQAVRQHEQHQQQRQQEEQAAQQAALAALVAHFQSDLQVSRTPIQPPSDVACECNAFGRPPVQSRSRSQCQTLINDCT